MKVSLSSLKQEKFSQFFGFSFASFASLVLSVLLVTWLYLWLGYFVIAFFLVFHLVCIAVYKLLNFSQDYDTVIKKWTYLIYVSLLLYLIYLWYWFSVCQYFIFNLIAIIIPALMGYYLKDNGVIRYWIYLTYIALLLYAIYTWYDAATCEYAKCEFIALQWFLAIISANLILFSFLYHFKCLTRMYPIKVMWWCLYIIMLQNIILFLLVGFLNFFL